MNPLRWFSALLIALALVAGAALWLQRQVAAELRDEIALLREEGRELGRLRAENARLRAAQVPPAELERLRADRAAVVRLRAEIEKTEDNVQARERALAAPPRAVAGADLETPPPPPALVLALAVGPSGGLAIDGAPFDLAAIKPRLMALPRGERIELRLQIPRVENQAQADEAKRNIRQAIDRLGGIVDLAKELGLKVSTSLVDAPRG